ncbi:hypothetical protein E1B28_002187 [Marasmius oreades]|uniref:Uncharacterized protein n=1 Tax=Marasmius oreades TaxID=181124 RepID=A0A9P7UMU8_9AGAR|nr:uncharacterized protein E1B28_002187 [Marasmius oreades]KAG7086221.1 hypothetical protein E1B28_002187 [Marasmius oreades]
MRQTSLLQRVRKYRDSLLVQIPSLRSLIEAEPQSESSKPEMMNLFLPSSLDKQSRTLILTELIQLEDQLRFAQAYESLSQLRAQLHSHSVVYKNMSRLQPSQGMYTKMNALQDKIDAQIAAIAATYRAARSALLQTHEHGEWMNSLKELQDKDIRGISE